MAMSIGLGLCLGASIGTALGDVGLWTGVGLCLGAAFGAAFDGAKERPARKLSAFDKPLPNPLGLFERPQDE